MQAPPRRASQPGLGQGEAPPIKRPPAESGQPSDALTARAIVGSALTENDATNSFAAARAQLPGPAICVVLLLIAAERPIRIHVVGNGRAAMFNSQCKDSEYVLVKFLRARFESFLAMARG